jgi:allophanate hydrolase
MQEASWLDVTRLRSAYRSGRLTPVDVVEQVIARMADRGDDHVWISRVPVDQLRDAARSADLDAPLGGIPFAVKDNIDVAGLPTTAGCPDFSYLPTTTAVAARRLLDAGALLVGKTNMDQFATGLSGTRSPYGACESVFGGDLISGGSSSGSAVAVAAGLVTFALGTDTAGSGRVPAALNGIVGVKPTRGLISTVGVVPACRSLDCVSVFAGSVADAALVAALAAGPPVGAWDRGPTPTAFADPLGETGALRLGVPDKLDFAGDTAMRDAFATAVTRAEATGAKVVPVDLSPFLAAGDLLYQGSFVAERLADLATFFAEPGVSVLPVTRQVIEAGAGYDAASVYRDLHRLRELAAAAAGVFTTVDALLLPTVPTTFTIAQMRAEPIRHNLTLGRYTQFVNLLDLAAVALPAGLTADGRPAGVSVIGPAFTDGLLAALASRLMSDRIPPSRAPVSCVDSGEETLVLAVVGKHLRGEAKHHELTERDARFVGTFRTAPTYRLYHLSSGLPGLVQVTSGGQAIEVELWRLPLTALGGLLAQIPAPLAIGRVRLTDGTEHAGFLCEAYATASARDITQHGGWRAFQASEAARARPAGQSETAPARPHDIRPAKRPDPMEER